MPDSTGLGPDFRRFLVAAASSNLGDGIRLGALPLLALSLTDDARLIALVSASALLPWVVFGPIGGAIVDRHDRRRLMIAGQAGRAMLVGALVAMIATDTVTIWWTIVLAFGIGAGEVIVDSSAQAAVPQLVEPDQFDRANGQLIAAVTVLDQVVGVALGAALFGLATELPFAIDALTFAVGALLLLTIRRPLQGERSTETTVRTDIAEGARFLFRHPFLRRSVAAITTANLAGNMAFGVIVVLVVDELGASEATFGLVLGVGALGGIAGSLVAARLSARLGRRRLILLAATVLPSTYLLNSVATSHWVVSMSFGLASFAVVCGNVPGQSIRQAVTPDHLHGRVVATSRVFGFGAGPAGAVLGGIITQAANVRVANVAAAGVGAVACALMVAALRHLDDAHVGVDPSTRS